MESGLRRFRIRLINISNWTHWIFFNFLCILFIINVEELLFFLTFLVRILFYFFKHNRFLTLRQYRYKTISIGEIIFICWIKKSINFQKLNECSSLFFQMLWPYTNRFEMEKEGLKRHWLHLMLTFIFLLRNTMIEILFKLGLSLYVLQILKEVFYF